MRQTGSSVTRAKNTAWQTVNKSAYAARFISAHANLFNWGRRLRFS
jgi:hypothetical protein